MEWERLKNGLLLSTAATAFDVFLTIEIGRFNQLVVFAASRRGVDPYGTSNVNSTVLAEHRLRYCDLFTN
jgi:hypothetical protein